MKVTEATTMLMVIKAVRLALGALTPWDCRVADTAAPRTLGLWCGTSPLFVLLGASEVLVLHF